jgi:hypothetical protein
VALRLWEQEVRTSTLANVNASALVCELEETAAVRLLSDLERLGLIVDEEMAVRLVDHAGGPPTGLRVEPHRGASRRSGIAPIATPEARDDEAI